MGKKKIKGLLCGMEETKLFVFTEDVIVYVENLKKAKK